MDFQHMAWFVLGFIIGGVFGWFLAYGRAAEHAVRELREIQMEYELVIKTLQGRIASLEETKRE